MGLTPMKKILPPMVKDGMIVHTTSPGGIAGEKNWEGMLFLIF